MNRVCVSLLAGLFAISAHAELFISEYVEGSTFGGSSTNKAIEIFNPGTLPVNLSTYHLRLYSNGSPSYSQTMNLRGTLNAGTAFVITHAGACPDLLSKADTTSSAVINFNGDDAVALFNGTTQVDVFGQIGFDPGTQWGAGSACGQVQEVT